MQTVTSVANPLYGVATLTSAASSTVKRTRVAIPSNQEGKYSHNKNSRYTATCTLGSNQDGIITENTFWEFDITPTFYDTENTPSDGVYPSPYHEPLTPLFDQDINALVARMRILLPQGMVIEDLPMYNQLCNIISSYATDAQKKETNLIGMGAYSKNVFKERGHNPIIDAPFFQSPTFGNSLRHGRATRVQIPFVMSSFMKTCKYIPLFLLRNGIQFELEFEDPYRAFVQNMSKVTHNWAQNNIPASAQIMYVNATTVKTIRANFTFGPGSVDEKGQEKDSGINYADNATYVAGDYTYPPFWRLSQRELMNNASTGFLTRLLAASAGIAPVSLAPGCFNLTNLRGIAPAKAGNQMLQYCKNFLYLDPVIARPMLDKKIDVARSFLPPTFLANGRTGDPFLEQNALGYGLDELVFCVPFVLKRDGVPVHRFFTAISLFLDGYSWARKDAGTWISGTRNIGAGADLTLAEITKVADRACTVNLALEDRWAPVKWGHFGSTADGVLAAGASEAIGAAGAEATNIGQNGTAFRHPLFSCLFNAGGFNDTLVDGGARIAFTATPYFIGGAGSAAVAANVTGIQESVSNFAWQGYRKPALTPWEPTGSMFHGITESATNIGVLITANVAQKAMTQVMYAFPVYKYNHFKFGERDDWVGEIPVFPMNKDEFKANVFYPDFFNSNYTLDIGVEDSFLLRLTSRQTVAGVGEVNIQGGITVRNTSSHPNLYDPIIRDMQHVINHQRHYMSWNYTIENVRMICDMCQPASDVFAEYSKAFQSRIGIPYAITRIVTCDRNFDTGSSGAQQFVVPISARSVRNLIVTFDDNYFTGFQRHTLGAMYTPMLSSFMRRGLVQLSLTIGGSTKPEYTLRFDKNGGVEHLAETTSSFGVPYVTGFTPCFSRHQLAPVRSYLTGASNMDVDIGTWITNWKTRTDPDASIVGLGITPTSYGIDYVDASKFIIGIPLQRTDAFPFASGLDSTMTASLILTATFELDGPPNMSGESKDSGKTWKRPIHMTVRGAIDNVITLQNDLSSSRW